MNRTLHSAGFRHYVNGREIMPGPATVQTRGQYVCEVCNRSFPLKQALMSHQHHVCKKPARCSGDTVVDDAAPGSLVAELLLRPAASGGDDWDGFRTVVAVVML